MKYAYKIALSFAMENKEIVEDVYHYLKAEGISVFFAPARECQSVISGKNQREIFYKIFGLDSEYVALFVSKDYVSRKVPMEEAKIAIAKHSEEGNVIPIYLDNTALPGDMFNPYETNYYKSNNPAEIANHLAVKVKYESDTCTKKVIESKKNNNMNVNNNTAQKQVFIQTLEGNIDL